MIIRTNSIGILDGRVFAGDISGPFCPGSIAVIKQLTTGGGRTYDVILAYSFPNSEAVVERVFTGLSGDSMFGLNFDSAENELFKLVAQAVRCYIIARGVAHNHTTTLIS